MNQMTGNILFPFTGAGEMAERCRAFDWPATALGPTSTWSQSLRTMASAVLASRNPMLLFWGPELIQIYNDAFRPSLGPATGCAARHPRALGMSAKDFWTDVWAVVGPQIEGVMARGEAVWFEDLYLPIERGEGVLEDAWWTYSYSPVRDDDGSIGGTLVVCLETTSTVRSRAAAEFERSRLADLFRHAPAFIAVLRGPDHVFELVNDEYRKVVGFRDLTGRTAREALPEVEGQGFFELLDEVYRTGKPFVGRELQVEIQPAPGEALEQRHMTFVYQAITEADGSHSGVFVHGVDITESVRARAVAEAANRSKSEFMAVMSHELRTPLNAIDGYAEVLELGIHGPLTDEQRDDIARIRKSERHLLGLINDVLNYARLEAGTVHYDIEDVVLDEVLTNCEALTAPQSRARNLQFQFVDCSPELTVRADREKLQQVILNLLSNAIKFTEPRGRVELSCGTEDEYAIIRVSDTGCGIPAGEIDRVFEAFVQVDARLTRTQNGIGLGLAISRDLARGMGGDITVASTPDVGSTFTLTVPRVV